MRARFIDFVQRVARLQARPLSRRLNTGIMVVAVLAFVLILFFAWHNRPELDSGIDFRKLLVAVLLLTPSTFFMKTLEYRVAARLVDHRPAMQECLEVAVLGAAANLLPVPGSAVVTTHSLSASGASLGRSAISTASVGLTWLAVSMGVGAGVIGATGRLMLGLVLGCLALGFAVAATVALRTHIASRTHRATAGLLVAVEVGFLVVATGRLTLVASAIGITAAWWHLAAFPMAAALGTAVGFVPSGLGVREGAMGLLAPAVGLPVASGLLIGVVDRLVWLAGLSLLAPTVLVRRELLRKEVRS